MEKINLVELLKDCPEGMELDCTSYENVVFDFIDEESDAYPIHCYMVDGEGNRNALVFTKNGCLARHKNAKCVIFPKGKTSWGGFVPPCQFKDGDIIFTHTNASKGLLEASWVSIFKEYRNNRCACYACLCLSDLELYHDKFEDELLCELCEIGENRLATEDEKEKLFQAIKDNGYIWDAETKTLENIEPKFKDGDVLFVDCSDDEYDKLYQFIFILKETGFYSQWHAYCYLDEVGKFSSKETYLTDGKYHPRFATEEEKAKLFKAIKDNGYKWNEETKTLEKLVAPRFKVGNRIRRKDGIEQPVTISSVSAEYYIVQLKEGEGALCVADQDLYELAPDKFDITTLDPFESRVLVRDNERQYWKAAFWGFFGKGEFLYDTTRGIYKQCIPYEGNQHLLGTTDDCDEFYKTWE